MGKPLPAWIEDYCRIVESGRIPVCNEQILLVKHVRKCFETEDIYVDEEQAEKYFALEKYFPYRLLAWERFCFVLHNCTYTADGQLRWPVLLIVVGRGTGKNGYLSFEDFALTTPINGVMHYNIDIFAMSEDNARTSFDEIYEVLEANKVKMKNHFRWTKEEIFNLKTRSKIKFRTSAPRTKDGFRPGKVDFDEVHAYESSSLIDVAVTGLGKEKHPRRTYITSEGDVRDGPLDSYKESADLVLKGEMPDNGWLYFICRCESDEEIGNPDMWIKAIPSINDFPQLKSEMLLELAEWKRDPISNSAFATKRCGRPYGEKEFGLTSWENIMACCGDMPDLSGKSCVCGIDFAQITDFAAAVLLFYVDGRYYAIQHTWICKNSKDLGRIRFPWKNAVKRGEATLVDDVDIDPGLISGWLEEMAKQYNIIAIACDTFRYTALKAALAAIGFLPDLKRRERSRLNLLRLPGDLMKIAPIISTVLEHQQLTFGDVLIMRWYMGNIKRRLDGKGNTLYEKVEQRSRKTDGAMALIMAFTLSERLVKVEAARSMPRLSVRTY